MSCISCFTYFPRGEIYMICCLFRSDESCDFVVQVKMLKWLTHTELFPFIEKQEAWLLLILIPMSILP